MSLASRVSDLAARIAAEVKSVRADLRYDPQSNLYVPADYTLANFRNRVHAAKYGRQTAIAVLGSSSVGGYGATTKDQGWVWQLRKRFANDGYPIWGTGLAFVGQAKIDGDPRWTFSATGVTASMTLEADIANTAWAEYTADVFGKYVKVFYYDNAGPFSIAIDGGTPVTITPGGTGAVLSWTSSFMAAGGFYKVRITGTGGTAAKVVGVETYGSLSESGIAITSASIAGSTTANWSINTWNSPLHHPLKRAPALAIFAVNGNDFTLGVPQETMKTRYTTMVNVYRYFNCEPLLLLMPVTSAADRAAYRAHAGVLYEVADSMSVALLDMDDRWGPYNLINGAGLSADGTHPSDRGHELYADAVYSAITGFSSPPTSSPSGTPAFVVVNAGTNLGTARPTGDVVYWKFNAGVNPGINGANVTNAVAGDLFYVAGS